MFIYFSAKKTARLSASEMADVWKVEVRNEDDSRCIRL